MGQSPSQVNKLYQDWFTTAFYRRPVGQNWRSEKENSVVPQTQNQPQTSAMTWREDQKGRCHSIKVLEDLYEWEKIENKLQPESQHMWEHLGNLKARMDLILLELGGSILGMAQTNRSPLPQEEEATEWTGVMSVVQGGSSDMNEKEPQEAHSSPPSVPSSMGSCAS